MKKYLNSNYILYYDDLKGYLLKRFDRSQRDSFHFCVERIFVANCKKREKKAIKSDRKMFLAHFRRDDVQMHTKHI